MSEAIEAGLSTPEVAQSAATPDNVAAPAPDTEAAPEVETQAEKTFTQKELDEIVQKRIAKAEAIADRRAMKAYKETLERIVPRQEQQQAPVDNGRPTQANYANVDDYVEAMADWKLGQRDQKAQQEYQQQQAQTLNAKTENFYTEAQKIPGFDRDAFEELPLTRAIAAAIIEADAPAQLMAHLAAHPEEAERIAGLSPTRQVAEMAKLEGKLVSAPKVSSAPAPIKPIGSRGAAANSDLSKASMEDYMAARKAQGARWAR